MPRRRDLPPQEPTPEGKEEERKSLLKPESNGAFSFDYKNCYEALAEINRTIRQLEQRARPDMLGTFLLGEDVRKLCDLLVNTIEDQRTPDRDVETAFVALGETMESFLRFQDAQPASTSRIIANPVYGEISKRILNNCYPRLQKIWEPKGSEDVPRTAKFRTVYLMAKSPDDSEKQTSTQLLEANIDPLLKNVRIESDPEILALGVLLAQGSPEARDKILTFAAELINERSPKRSVVVLDRWLLDKNIPTDTQASIKKIEQQLLERYIKSEMFREIFEKEWLDDQLMPAWVVASNLYAIRALEKKHPGLVESLFKEYGIVNFGRYPSKMMVDQWEAAGKEHKEGEPLKKLGVMVVARHDYTKGRQFSRPALKTRPLWEEFYEDFQDTSSGLGQHYGIRVFEARSKRGVERALLRTRKEMGGQKIPFGIVNAHGNTEGVSLGGGTSSGSGIRISDLELPSAEELAGAFEEHAPVAMLACLTGEEEKFAQKVAEKARVDVIASNTTATIRSIKASEENGKIKLKVVFDPKRALRTFIAPDKETTE